MSKHFKTISLKKNYDDFSDFYDDNKEIIYKSIIEIFKEFKNTRKRKLSLYVVAKINDINWDTEFNFTKNDTIVLKRDVMPYFEQIEDYATCCEIRDLHNVLNK
jgi:hypothetical protein